MSRFLIIAICLTVPFGAAAQEANQDPQEARTEAELRVEAAMVQLNSIVDAMAMNLGQLQYLRALCLGRTDQKWRTYASQLIEMESPNDGARRETLIQAFNKGYYLEEGRHGVCSDAAVLDVAALAENGRKLAGMLGHPYREDE